MKVYILLSTYYTAHFHLYTPLARGHIIGPRRLAFGISAAGQWPRCRRRLKNHPYPEPELTVGHIL